MALQQLSIAKCIVYCISGQDGEEDVDIDDH